MNPKHEHTIWIIAAIVVLGTMCFFVDMWQQWVAALVMLVCASPLLYFSTRAFFNDQPRMKGTLLHEYSLGLALLGVGIALILAAYPTGGAGGDGGFVVYGQIMALLFIYLIAFFLSWCFAIAYSVFTKQRKILILYLPALFFALILILNGLTRATE